MSARDHWLEVQKNADTENGHAAGYSTPDPMATPAPPPEGDKPQS